MAQTQGRTELHAGAKLKGHKDAYQILEHVNAGANGIVYRARASGGGDVVALKLFSPRDNVSAAEFEKLRENFKNEVPKTRVASHWGVMQVLDWGTALVNRRRTPFWVMECAARDLRKALASDSLGLFTKCFHSAMLCDAVEYINTRGQVHRDIKPENILLDEAGLPKIADLGIAEFIPGFEKGVLKDYSFYSEPQDPRHPRHYFSPEQLRRAMGVRDVDVSHSDRFQLGKVIHEIFTGINPIGQLHPRSKIYQDVPKTVCKLLLSMLAEEAEQRPRLADCAAVLYGEAAMSLHAAETAFLKLARKTSTNEREAFLGWFRNDNTYDPGLSRGNTRPEILIPRWTKAGLIRVNPRTAGTQGCVTLTPLGRDVRDMLIHSRPWWQVIAAYRALERSPSHRLPDWGTSEWLFSNPRRRIPADRLAFCQKSADSWGAYTICPPLQLGNSWWVEIYDGELPLPDSPRFGETKEWLVRFGAPLWLKRGQSLQEVLAATRHELLKAGIAKAATNKAIAKLRELAGTKMGVKP